MATTVHVPADLLSRVDARAKALGVSRNRLIVLALEERLGTRDEWPPELVRMLARPISERAAKELEESMAIVKRRRTRRRRAPVL